MKNFILLAAVMLFMLSCKTTNRSLENVEPPEKLQEWIANRSFEIESDRANPKVSSGLNRVDPSLFGYGNNANNISLVGDPNYLRVKNDSVSAYLPYYGNRHIGVKIGSNTGAIQFNTVAKNYSSEYNEAKNQTTIQFEAKEDTEIYNVTISIFSNLTTNITINSSQRSSIGYDGIIAEYTAEE